MALGRIGPCGCYFLLTCYGQELKTLSRSEAVLQLTVTVAVTSFYAVTPFPPVVLQDGTIRTTRASFCLIAKLAETQTASWRGLSFVAVYSKDIGQSTLKGDGEVLKTEY